MKSSITLLLPFCVSLASGFSPSAWNNAATRTHVISTSSSLAAASTHEEDLELTRKVIMDYIATTDLDSGAIVDDDDDEGASNTPVLHKMGVFPLR